MRQERQFSWRGHLKRCQQGKGPQVQGSTAESDDQPLNKVALLEEGLSDRKYDLVDEGSTANPEQPSKEDTRI